MKPLKGTRSREMRMRQGDMQVPGTSLSVAEVSAILADRRSCEDLFRWFPTLDPNDLRDAVERGVNDLRPTMPCKGIERRRANRSVDGSWTGIRRHQPSG